MSASPEAAGTIYDIGYRRYDGPRLGRRGAIGAIVGAGLRASSAWAGPGARRSSRGARSSWPRCRRGRRVAIRVLAGDIIELYNYQNYLWEIGGCCRSSWPRRRRSSS
jgi:hypothetical protein